MLCLVDDLHLIYLFVHRPEPFLDSKIHFLEWISSLSILPNKMSDISPSETG